MHVGALRIEIDCTGRRAGAQIMRGGRERDWERVTDDERVDRGLIWVPCAIELYRADAAVCIAYRTLTLAEGAKSGRD